jgi:DNA-binding response OmpR family regulator
MQQPSSSDQKVGNSKRLTRLHVGSLTTACILLAAVAFEALVQVLAFVDSYNMLYTEKLAKEKELWEKDRELERIQKQLRAKTAEDGDTIWLDGMYAWSVSQRKLTRDGIPVHLTHKLRDTLELLLLHRNKLVGNEMIEYHVWPETTEVKDSTRMALVNKLRKQLDGRFIRTVQKEGYVLETE